MVASAMIAVGLLLDVLCVVENTSSLERHVYLLQQQSYYYFRLAKRHLEIST